MDYSTFDPSKSLPVIMGKAARAMAARLQNIFFKAGYDITAEQWMILLVLWKEDGQFQQQLADAISKDKATLTRQIDGLEKKNLIVRIPDKTDRRQKRIYLTNRGKEMELQLVPLGIENAQNALSGISPDEIESCKNVLQKVYNNLLGN